MQLLLSLLLPFVDIGRAAWNLLRGQKRVAYTWHVDVNAPPAAVWALLSRRDVTYAASGFRSETLPIEGRPGVHQCVGTFNSQRFTFATLVYLDEQEPRHQAVRFLREPEAIQASFGEDDNVVTSIADLGNGKSRVMIMRELTHVTLRTHLLVPFGLRNGGYLIKSQVEHETGHAATGSSKRNQLALSLAAFASFVWLFGLMDAAIIAAGVVIHEFGHALAMLHYRLGVSMITLIPFFGGMAAPKRYYESEWQHGIVALAGVAFSLPFVVALYLFAEQNADEVAAKAAFMFAILNAVNLVPFPGIDGGIVTNLLLRKMHPTLARFGQFVMLALLVGLAVKLSEPLIWVAVAFSCMTFLYSGAMDDQQFVRPMRWPLSIGLAVIYLSLIAAYIAAVFYTYGLTTDL